MKLKKIKETSIELVDGDRGKNYPTKNEFHDNEYCLFLNASNITPSGFDFTTTSFINKHKDETLRSGKLQKNDIVMMTRGSVGNVAIYDDSVPYDNIRINSGMIILRPKGMSAYRLYYQMKSPFVRKQIENLMSGSVQSQLPATILREIKIVANDIYVDILKDIDKFIINNNKINHELEELSKTIYDYWFLQFDFPNNNGQPFKKSGGKMIWNESLKREIPEGWEAVRLSNIIRKVNRDFDNSTESKTFDLSIMPSNSIAIYNTSSSTEFDTNLFTVKTGDLLFGSIRPYLRKAGIASYDGAVAGTVHCFEVINEYDYNFALFTLTSENMFRHAINNSNGTKMPVVSSDDILNFIVPYNREVAKKFNKITIKDELIANVHQTNELSSIRDFLLPLLMNGQVTFN